MKNVLQLFLIIMLCIGYIPSIHAQTPTDAIFMPKGQICLAAIYGHETWDEYWEGTLKRENGNIGTLTRQTILPMFALGLHDRINVLAALPWMKTEASAGQVTGASGLQDWSIWLKGDLMNLPLGNNNLALLATASLSGPASNYLPDFAPFNLGLGCIESSLRLMLHYEMEKGPYARLHGAYHLRGTSTIERDYYYTTHGVYSDQVNIPEAVTYGAVLGTWLFGKSMRVQAAFDGLNTLGGFDIRRQDAGFPSNKMLFTRVGLDAQYHFSFLPGLGVVASGSRILTGRNVGQSTALSFGVIYFFQIWK